MRPVEAASTLSSENNLQVLDCLVIMRQILRKERSLSRATACVDVTEQMRSHQVQKQ